MISFGSPTRSKESTHQTFRAGVYDGNQQKADREPRFGIAGVEISERYYPKSFHRRNAQDADSGLYGQEQKVHGEVTS
jgi:hypothetical protein